MLKKMLLITLLMIGTIVFAANENTKKNTKTMIHDLVIIPFPGGKMFKTGKIKLSDEQKTNFATNIRPIMHEKYNPLLQEIFVLEKSLRRDIRKKSKTFDDKLKSKIAKIARLKQEATEYKIEAVLKIKSVLTKEQWQVWISN